MIPFIHIYNILTLWLILYFVKSKQKTKKANKFRPPPPETWIGFAILLNGFKIVWITFNLFYFMTLILKEHRFTVYTEQNGLL